MSAVERVLVVGAGTMGAGIAQVVASSGLEVSLVDVSDEAVARGRGRIERALGRSVAKGRLEAAEAQTTLDRLRTGSDLESEAARTDHVIETVVEDLAVKTDVLARLDAACGDHVVLASNTSQFSISRLAAATGRPDRVIGSHWFNPPPLMDLIEVVRGVRTSDATLATTLELAARYGKQTVLCLKDTPGFITSRLMVALALEAARIVDEGVAGAADVDKACTLAFNHAMGPLDTIDFSGLDVTLHVADAMRASYGSRFLAPQNLRALVSAGQLGRKTGQGFGSYEQG